MVGKMEHTDNITKQDKARQGNGLTPEAVAEVFGAEFLDERACEAFVFISLHGKTLTCPGCGAAVPELRLHGLRIDSRIRCHKCGKFFTALTGTFLSGTHMSSREVVLLSMLLGLGVQDKEVARILKISAESVRLWRLKYRAQEEIKGAVIG